mmetsp:Transcript_80853/g.121524  ORF Transcript_80853/g.121524 Transcript_80853/m.121524 type:complete len:233 (+) Transcript_80853:88-786(+)
MLSVACPRSPLAGSRFFSRAYLTETRVSSNRHCCGLYVLSIVVCDTPLAATLLRARALHLLVLRLAPLRAAPCTSWARCAASAVLRQEVFVELLEPVHRRHQLLLLGQKRHPHMVGPLLLPEATAWDGADAGGFEQGERVEGVGFQAEAVRLGDRALGDLDLGERIHGAFQRPHRNALHGVELVVEGLALSVEALVNRLCLLLPQRVGDVAFAGRVEHEVDHDLAVEAGAQP